jgi:Zn-dependent peptidase ImmA (M78 family)
MLLTNRARGFGSILVNMAHGARRARFSIGHELGHFLLERHVLSQDNGFRCTSRDMREVRDDTRHRMQEAEANHFAIALLAPVYKMRPCLDDDPDLRTLQKTADALDLSLEATIRRYLDFVDVPVAAIWTKDSKVRTAKRHRDLPWITRGKGDALSDLTQAWRAIRNGRSGFTDVVDSPAAAWTDRDGVEVYEQTRVGRDGHAVTLLWADLLDDDDIDEGGPAKLGVPGFGKSRRRK